MYDPLYTWAICFARDTEDMTIFNYYKNNLI